MKKVLVVSYCFPPIDMIAAKRFGTMCKYFKENGYEPYVLTTKPNGDWGVNVRMDLDIPIGKEQIIQIGTNESNGIIKNFWGKHLVNFLNDYKYSSRTISAIALGWYEKVKNNIDLAQLWDIDVIVGTYPVVGDLFVACYLARKLKCPYIADVRDLISDYSEIAEGYKRAKLLDIVIEKYVLYKASGIVTVTPGFRDILKLRYPKKSMGVVFNGWDEERQKLSGKPEYKYLYYAGSMYLHRLESLELLIECINKINMDKEEKIKLVIRSIGPKKMDIKLKQMVKYKGMQEYISIFEAADEKIVQEEQENAYINVVLSTSHKEDMALMATVPGKVYELLNKRTPMLAIAPKNSDVGRVLQYTNKGIASISEDEIIDFILGECEQYKGNEKINYFTRKKQAERFCRFMDKILGI